jgi:MmoB/DmpM family protein
MNALEVGPVLTSGVAADAVVLAIREENAEVRVDEHAGYLRVLVPGRCTLSASAVARALGRPFVLPRDLELIMPSFKGRLHIDHAAAVWEASPR